MNLTYSPSKNASAVANFLKNGAILLDVRTIEEFVGSHFKGALHIAYDQLDSSIPMIKSWNKPVVVYSTYGRRSQLATQLLQNNGIKAIDGGGKEALFSLLK